MEIGDLNEKESKDYLIKRCTIEKKEGNLIKKECKIKDEQVNELYKLVGGRIVDLKDVADEFLAGKSLEDIKQQVLIKVEEKLISSKLLEDHYEAGMCTIKALMILNSNQKINYSTFLECLKQITADEVLNSNIFSNNTVTFQSRSVENGIQKYANIYKKL